MAQPPPLNVVINRVSEKVVYGMGITEVVKIDITMDYVCTKIFGKCLNDFTLNIKITNPLNGVVDYRINSINTSPQGKVVVNRKLIRTIQTAEAVIISIPFTIRKGKARETVSASISVYYNPESLVKKDSFIIDIGYTPKGGSEERILSRSIDIEVIPPYRISADISVGEEYKQKALFIGDPVELVIDILPHVNDKLRIVIDYPGEPITKEYALYANKGIRDRILLKLAEEGDRITVRAIDEEVGYEETITIPIRVSPPPRTRILDHWIEGEAVVGSTLKVYARIRNDDFILPVEAYIEVLAYGSRAEKTIVIDPEGEETVEFEIQVLGESKNTIVVQERIEGAEPISYRQALQKLPAPEKPEVEIGLIADKVRVIHGEDSSTGVIITASSRIPLNAVVEYRPIQQLDISVEERTIEPGKTVVLPVRIGGLEPGSYTLRLNVKVTSRDIVVYEKPLDVNIEVIPRFHVHRAKIFSPGGGELVVVGERARLLIEVESNLDRAARVEVEASDNIVLEEHEIILQPGKKLYEIPCIARKPGRATIFVRDDVHEEAIDTINEIRPPEVSASINIVENVFTGIPLALGVVFRNETHIAPKVVYKLRATRNVVFYAEEKTVRTIEDEAYLEPRVGAVSSRTYIILVPEAGNAVVELEYTPIHTVGHETYTGETKTVRREFTAEYPLRVLIDTQKIVLRNPYPATHVIFGKSTWDKVLDIKLMNMSAKKISGISISITGDSVPSFILVGNERKSMMKDISLEGKYQMRLKALVQIPFSLLENRTVKVVASFPSSRNVAEEDISIVVEPQIFIDILYPPNSYDAECVKAYPHHILENGWAEVLIPITDNPMDCGNPYEASMILYSIAKEAIEGLRKKLVYATDFYSILARYIIESMVPGGDIEGVKRHIREAIADFVTSIKDYAVFMEVAWAIALCKHSGVCSSSDLNRLASIMLLAHVPQPVIPLTKDKLLYNPGPAYVSVRKLLFNPHTIPHIPQDPLAGEIMAMYTILTGKPIYSYGAISYLIKTGSTQELALAIASGGWKTLLNTRFSDILRQVLKDIITPKNSLAAALITRYASYKAYTKPSYASPLYHGMTSKDLEELSRGVI